MASAEQAQQDNIALAEDLDAQPATAEGATSPEETEVKPEASSSKDEKSEPALPPLSDHEFKQYNRLAEHMDYFVRTPAPIPPIHAHATGSNSGLTLFNF